MKGRCSRRSASTSRPSAAFAPEFAKTIHGAGGRSRFFATGISLVAHMANPHVPAVHMNTRFLYTTKRWFGGGADLNPPIPHEEDTPISMRRSRLRCDAHDAGHYPRFKQWADDYFWIPHRKVHRGVGGIFYDHLEGDFDANFAFTRAVGEAFLDIYPRSCGGGWGHAVSEADRARCWRGGGAMRNSTWSMTGARRSASRPAAISTQS
jgi:coproporphyrinogen III oxidase